MKIAGQPFGEIWDKLPWRYKAIFVLGAVFSVFAFINLPFQLLTMNKRRLSEAVALELPGAGALDPALAANGNGGNVFMAYTAQGGGAQQISSVRLAFSDRSCARWVRIPDAGFDGKQDALIAPDGKSVLRGGAWRVETPSLVYDPGDAGREWKMFAYKYFWSNAKGRDASDSLAVVQRYGAIVIKTAHDPLRGPWSQEQWLFAAAPDFPPPPYQNMVLLHLDRLAPQELGNMVSYSRPSAIVRGGAIYMTLSAFTPGMTLDRVILIVSRDHGASWAYAGTVMRGQEAAALDAGYTGIAGATLLQRGETGKAYLALTPSGKEAAAMGTVLIPFDDLDHAKLAAKPALTLGPPSPPAGLLGAGMAAYSGACDPSGLIVAQQDSDARYFKLYLSRKDLPKDK